MIQRVNGSLAVSRALGDYDYKSVPRLTACQQLVSPEPDVYVVDRDLPLGGASGTQQPLTLSVDGAAAIGAPHSDSSVSAPVSPQPVGPAPTSSAPVTPAIGLVMDKPPLSSPVMVRIFWV